MHDKQIFEQVARVTASTGIAAYVVGGYVRDQYMRRQGNKDIDVVVAGSGITFAQAFAASLGEEVGRLVEFADFDTARFIYLTTEEEGRTPLCEIEFAGARTELYHEDSRKPVVSPTTIEQDLSRRDFTVNAMARLIEQDGTLGPVIDPFDGQRDIEHKTLNTPLDPDQTFIDDPLRMLRAARFAAQLQFSLDERVLLSMHKNKERIRIVSQERIQEELMKLFATVRPSQGLWLLHATRLLDECIPEVALLAGVEEVKGYSHKDNLSHTFAVIDNIAEQTPNPLLRFAGLMHDIAKPQTKQFFEGRGWTFDMHEHLGKKMTKEIMRRLKFSRNDIQYVSTLVRWHLQPIALMDKGVTDSAVRRLIVNLQELLPDLLMLCRADITTGNQYKKERRLKNYDYLDQRIKEVLEADKLRAFQSPLRGDEIMTLTGLKPGPTIGKIKAAIEEAILAGDIPNDYEAAKGYFEKIKEEYLAQAVDWEKNI